MSDRMYKRDKRSPVPKNSKVSEMMSRIKPTNSKPELLLRKHLFSKGLRGYRKNAKSLPGKPDIVYTKRKVAVFINGCYWHGCEECGWKPPAHNTEYWANKIQKNKQRDKVKIEKLEEIGYKVITIWEHEIKKDIDLVVDKIQKTLV